MLTLTEVVKEAFSGLGRLYALSVWSVVSPLPSSERPQADLPCHSLMARHPRRAEGTQ